MAQSKNILLIEDDDSIRKLLSQVLEMEGFQILTASSIKTGLRILESAFVYLVLCDVKLPDGDGIELVSMIKEKLPLIEIIVMTAYGSISDSVKAIKNGAFDYISKGEDNNRIIPLVNVALNKSMTQHRLRALEQKLNTLYNFDQILGNSRQIKEAKELAQKVSLTDVNILLTGETGTGKDIFAQAIHQNSLRKSENFVAINCSAFSSGILESEVFGYKAGAFTGATKDKKGLVEEANGGTLFLDEIGEMSLDLQAKFLRFLETGTFIKVGDFRTTKVNLRIIAATNRDLEKECEAGTFRLDLFYRLAAFQIKLPSLNERTKDIPILAELFMKSFSLKTNKRIVGMTEEFMEKLLSHRWKGNIRELKNVIERAVILNDDEILSVESLPIEFQLSRNIDKPNTLELKTIEMLHIQKVLHLTKGNKSQTARFLNIGMNTLYRKMKEYHL